MSTDADASSERSGADRTDRPADLPLPPYPPDLGRPLFHVRHLVRDSFEFTDRAVARNDVVRTHLVGTGDVYNLVHPDDAKRVLLTDRESLRKSEDFRIAFGEGLLTVEGEEWRQQCETLRPCSDATASSATPTG